MLSRRSFLQTNAVACGSAAIARGARGKPSGEQARDYWNDWPAYYAAMQRRARIRRQKELASIGSAEQARARNANVRETVWRLIGSALEKTPLNPQITGALERSGYRIDKVIFESQPRVYVSANLYVPTIGKPPYPGIVSPLGHYREGKAHREYQHLYQNLARQGLVVIAFDPYGQGERAQYINPGTEGSRYFAPGMEHNRAGLGLRLVGDSFSQYRVWDGIRALDYLTSLPEVDSARIGCVGHSGGGMMTMFLCALEPRIQTAVIVEPGDFYNFTRLHYEAPDGYGDAEQELAGSAAAGIDRADLVAAFAPKPALLCYTPQDGVDQTDPDYVTGVNEIFEEVRNTYRLMGAGERIRLFGSFLPHALNFANRRETYAWFRRWLRNGDGQLEEVEFDASPTQALNCTTTGQVLTAVGGRSIAQVMTDRWITVSRPDDNSAIQARLRDMLKLPRERTRLLARMLTRTEQRDIGIEEIEFQSEPGIRIPGWFLRPRKTSGGLPAILYLAASGKNAMTSESHEMQAAARQGYAVMAVDLRGLGSCRPRLPLASLTLGLNADQDMDGNYALAGLILDRPVLGQRVWDFIRSLDYLEQRVDVASGNIRVIGAAGAGLVALLGAAVDSRPRSLLCEGTLAEFRPILGSGEVRWGLPWVLTGMLKHFDVANVIATLAPKIVWCMNPVVPSDEKLEEQE